MTKRGFVLTFFWVLWLVGFYQLIYGDLGRLNKLINSSMTTLGVTAIIFLFCLIWLMAMTSAHSPSPNPKKSDETKKG